ncbi:MAG: sigma 54-interacting transcriptional regulator, partial [Candidatus Krumholzibacteria bacterium]|nr:sigma 54-interacting transcriptional regulator [Candidatus Krumholzibacteria bacterium]
MKQLATECHRVPRWHSACPGPGRRARFNDSHGKRNSVSPPPKGFDPPIVGSSAAAEKLRDLVLTLSRSEVSLLITGESGVGKEVLSRNLHRFSRRRQGPFVSINCAALSPGILESELFGHEKGAFTGAASRKIGRFEL